MYSVIKYIFEDKNITGFSRRLSLKFHFPKPPNQTVALDPCHYTPIIPTTVLNKAHKRFLFYVHKFEASNCELFSH